jgi:hypothetical protein
MRERVDMRKASCLLIAAALLLSSGCYHEVAFSGKHVPIPGPGTRDEKLAIAKSVLAALPSEKVRSQVHSRFPDLTSRQLRNIIIGATTMTFPDENNREEVHLYVEVYQDPPVPNDTAVIAFAARLLEDELRREMAAAGLPSYQVGTPPN